MTSTGPTWTILIPTLGERRALFERLLAALLPQTEGWGGRVLVRGWFNNGEPSLPEIRQCLIEQSPTDYVSFIDDDDLVPDYFVHETMLALSRKPDYVGWQVQCYSDGVPTAVAHHSLENGRWRNTPGRYFRDISHINPIRRDLALNATFRTCRPGSAEDRAWADQLRRARVLRSEIMIERIMYHYLYSTSRVPGEGSRWESHHVIHPVGGRTNIAHPNFLWGDRA